jgi:hypothetical protein
METLEELIRQASIKMEVSEKVLFRLLNKERVHLYLAESSRQSLYRNLREVIQQSVE